MFTKKVKVRDIKGEVYKEVTDWEAVGWSAFIVFIILAAISG